ncbi:MAG TPA: S8 family serine peptidase, partial [Thermoanaerobaculia bacterium]|nr:S8 family serine peptidase [Thermoanaerobaculia bacterium]
MGDIKSRIRASLVALGLLLPAAVALVPLSKAQAARTSPGPVNRLSLQDTAGKIAPQVLAETVDGASASVVVFLADQADVREANEMKNGDARGWFVYTTLKEHAERTQAGLRKLLDAQGASYRSYWAANLLIATADRRLVELLAARGDVARVDSNRPARWIEDPVVAPLRVGSDSPDVAEWGVQNVNAPTVWAMGFTGQGMVIAGQDTGIRWTHLALKNHYRGWNGTTADHNYNWHDAIHSGGGSCGANSLIPCDDNGHGTHTIGTTSGDDGAANQIGVAPGAKWIGCRNMDQGNGTPATYTECFQFLIAPTDSNGQNPDPALRPHVVNNSWACLASEGCTTRAELETIVNNTEAAGIFVAASAGNSGPGCSTVSDPLAIYGAAFSTGAIDINNTLAGFSSRGPSTFYTPNLLKPEISAPGVNVRSSYVTGDTAYNSFSGTSMASPHVAGVVALLWSARPQLVRDIVATKTVLENTANPGVTVNPAQTCGGTPSTTIPNNSFGYGRVDVLAAVNAVPTSTPTPTPTSTPTPTPPATAGADFYTLTSCRIADTRNAPGP